ncbi:hypothetical protein ABPG72_017957 [Tetrahymena utriculariae]
MDIINISKLTSFSILSLLIKKQKNFFNLEEFRMILKHEKIIQATIINRYLKTIHSQLTNIELLNPSLFNQVLLLPQTYQFKFSPIKVQLFIYSEDQLSSTCLKTYFPKLAKNQCKFGGYQISSSKNKEVG